MRPSHRDRILVRIQFSDGRVARSALAELSRDRELSVSMVRGRIFPEDSSFELEVSGPASKIKQFLRTSDTGGTSVGASSMGVP